MSSDPTADAPPPDGTDEEPTPCAHTEYEDGEAVEVYPATGEDATGVEADVWAVLYDVEDPEMPVSIVDLGLIYGVDVTDGRATVEMTLTYTGCPARKYLTEEVEERIAGVDGVATVDLELVWSPPWSLEMVTETGSEQLREFGLSV